MFSIPHLIIIFAVALMVFGPEKLPDLARNLGKIMGEFRRATGDLRSTFEDHMRDLERESELRRVREGQPTSPTPSQPPGLFTSQPIDVAVAQPALPGGGTDAPDDPPPPLPGTVATDAPNSFAKYEAPAPEQLQFESRESAPDDHVERDPEKMSRKSPEKVNDGRIPSA